MWYVGTCVGDYRFCDCYRSANLIHELGHFIAARLIGVTVLEFGIGFPPRAIKLFEPGGAEFTLNWLPIGGFVRPLGEDFVRPVGDAVTDEDRAAFEQRQATQSALEARHIKTKSVMEAGPWQRIFFMIAGVGMNFLGGFLLFVLAGLIGIPVVQSATIQVLGLAANSPAAQAGVQVGDVFTGLNGKPVAFSADVLQAFSGKIGQDVPITVKRGDQQLNLTLKPSSTASAEVGGVFVLDVQPNSPGEKAGLQIGDRITQLNDQSIKVAKDVYDFGNANFGKQVTMTYNRAGVSQTVTLTLNAKSPAIGVGIGSLLTDATSGVQLADMHPVTKVQGLSLGDALKAGLADTWRIVVSTVSVPVDLIKGTLSIQQARPSSVIGISQMGAQVIQQSVDTHQSYPILNFAAIISVAIGLTQLLPIPGLDGGRILFVLVELLRGKPINPEREGMVNLVGLMVLLGFMLIFVVNDLLNPAVLPALTDVIRLANRTPKMVSLQKTGYS